MTLIKATEAKLKFPMMAFLRDGDLRYFAYLDSLTQAPNVVFNDGRLIGMELINKKGERWIVRSAYRTEPEPPPRRWWQIWPFWSEAYAVFDLDLERLEPVDLDAVRQRIRDVHAANLRKAGTQEKDIKADMSELKRVRSFEKLAENLALDAPDGFYD